MTLTPAVAATQTKRLLSARPWMAGALLLLVLLSGCKPPESPPPETDIQPPGVQQRPFALPSSGGNGAIELSPGARASHLTGATEVVLGTGRFANPTLPTGAQSVQLVGSDVTLNFANVDVRDVLKSVLGDLLKLSYTVDPAVQGNITLQTGAPIPRSAVIGVLTNALQLSGVGLIQQGGLYMAVPVANAARTASIGGSVGFITRIVTPQYADAAGLEHALQPLVPPGASLKADPGRNLLIISGSSQDVANMVANVESFDVDYLKGMSFALLPLRNGRARDVSSDLNKIFATSLKPIASMVNVVPIERMNALLVTSMQPSYLQRVREWVERIDRGDGHADQQLFIYRVQNGRATDLARVLRRALGIGGGGAGGQAGPGGLADTDSPPGGGTGVVSGMDTIQNTLSGGADNGSPSGGGPSSAPPPLGAGQNALLGSIPAAAAAAASGAPQTSVRITADTTNNALIINATPQEYAPIEAALEKLDITPLQVLVDATVAEVTLTDELKMGLQYFIKSGNFAGLFLPGISGSAGISSNATQFPGVGVGSNVTVAYSSGGTNLVLQALASLTTVRVLSSPDLLVLNNGTARLQVGDQLPISTQSATSTLTNTAQTVNAISYRDTGVILNITPRVNASGLVLLDMSEEVSQAVAPTVSNQASAASPTISKRSVTSSLAINDGQTICLAGLIQENRSNGNSGLPWLKDIPVLGFIFGQRADSLKRTELIVLVTPHVIRNREDVDAVATELRQKLRMAVPVAARVR